MVPTKVWQNTSTSFQWLPKDQPAIRPLYSSEGPDWKLYMSNPLNTHQVHRTRQCSRTLRCHRKAFLPSVMVDPLCYSSGGNTKCHITVDVSCTSHSVVERSQKSPRPACLASFQFVLVSLVSFRAFDISAAELRVRPCGFPATLERCWFHSEQVWNGLGTRRS